jgi:hypothetical protein
MKKKMITLFIMQLFQLSITLCPSSSFPYLFVCVFKQIAFRKIWGFQVEDYEEFRLLGHKNAVLTSLEIHYISRYRAELVNGM